MQQHTLQQHTTQQHTTQHKTTLNTHGKTTQQHTAHQWRCPGALRRVLSGDRGQTTSEYALVLLAAGTIAMLLVGWAQGNGAIGGLFDAVLARVTALMA